MKTYVRNGWRPVTDWTQITQWTFSGNQDRVPFFARTISWLLTTSPTLHDDDSSLLLYPRFSPLRRKPTKPANEHPATKRTIYNWPPTFLPLRPPIQCGRKKPRSFEQNITMLFVVKRGWELHWLLWCPIWRSWKWSTAILKRSCGLSKVRTCDS